MKQLADAFHPRRHPARLAVLVACILGTAGLLRTCGPGAGPASWYTVMPKDQTQFLVEKGVLEPSELTPVYAPIEGPLARIPRDGSPVNTGDELFVIDEQELQEDLDESLERVNDLETNLDIQNRQHTLLERKYAARKREELAELEHARIVEREGLIPLTESEQRQRDIENQLAQLDLEDAQEKLARQQHLVDEGFASPTLLEPLQREVESAATYLEELHATLALLQEGVTEEQRTTLRTAVTQAEAVVNRSQARHERQTHTSQLKVDSVEHDLAHAQATLNDRRGLKDDTRILAPTTGVVRLRSQMSWVTGRRMPINVGQNTHPADILADIIDPSTMNIALYIHESDILGLSTGMTARVVLSAYSDETFTGTVTRISQLGRDRSELRTDSQTAAPTRQSLFKALVDFDARGKRIRPGMTATVSLVRSNITGGLVIPRSALLYREGTPHVIRKGDSHPVRIQGEVIDDLWFSVAEGLRPRDQVQSRAETGTPP